MRLVKRMNGYQAFVEAIAGGRKTKILSCHP